MTRFNREPVALPVNVAPVTSSQGHVIVDFKDAPIPLDKRTGKPRTDWEPLSFGGDLLVLLRGLAEMHKDKAITLSPYAIFAPDYDARGFIAEEYGDDGLVKKGKKGKPILKTVDLATAIREVEDGLRTVTMAQGFDHSILKCKTYKLNVMRTRRAAERTPSKAVESFDMAAYFMAKAAKPKK